MKAYFQSKTGAVQYAQDLLTNSEQDLPLTMTIKPEKSGVYSVSCVTGIEWVDIQKTLRTILKQHMLI